MKSKLYDGTAFGFTQDKSHTEAVNSIVHSVEKAFDKGKVAILVRLDVDQAFPSAWHPAILHTLITNNCPKDLILMLQSFLTDRVSELWFAGHTKPIKLSASTAQGARLSPNLWKAVNLHITKFITKWMADRSITGITVTFADDNSILLIGENERELCFVASDSVTDLIHI